MKNIFQEISEKKIKVKKLADQALEYQWISTEEHANIIQKIENDILTIGVIGQMKCGKSTFLNALLFGKEVLPSATTPMTASLSVITYGETKSLEAEFYTSNEWAELKLLSQRNIEEIENDENLVSKIKAAKEIVLKAKPIESQINNLLGIKKTDSFERLIEYVGADGKYIAITKSVRIYYPLDYLKGIEIVDTPGFNDPVVSREERTKEFLSKADAVVMLLYAGRAFDSTDKDIIFNQLRSIGIGKLLIGVNKYDLSYQNGETEAQIMESVKNQLLRASSEYHNSSIAELVREKDPLLVSANMALMSKMDISQITNDENVKFYYNKALDIFEISTQKEMFQSSLFPAFEKALMDIIFNSKEEILLKKPTNFILQKAENQLTKIAVEIEKSSNELTILGKPDSELEDLMFNLEKAKKRIYKKLDYLDYEMQANTLDVIKDIRKGVNEEIESSRNRVIKEINNSNWLFTNKNELWFELSKINSQLEREIKNSLEETNRKLKTGYKNVINEFIYEIEDIGRNYLEDFDIQDSMKGLKKNFLEDIVQISVSDLIKDEVNENKYDNFNWKDNLREIVNDHYDCYELSYVDASIKENSKQLFEVIQKQLVNEFLDPLIEQTERCQNDKKSKENRVKDVQNSICENKKKEQVLKGQLEELQVIKHEELASVM